MKSTFRQTRGHLTAERIVKLYRSGLGARAIAALHGSTRGAICALLRRRTSSLIDCAGRAGKFKKHDRIKGKLSKDEIIRLYSHTGLSAKKIARTDGTTPTIILRIIKQAGCAVRPATTRIKHGLHQQAKKLGLPPETYLRFKAICALGAKCVKCGISDLRVLQLNHLTKKEGLPHYHEFMSIIKNGSKVHDVRCANCNIIYEFERGRRQYPASLFAELTANKAEQHQASLQSPQAANLLSQAKSDGGRKNERLRDRSASGA